MDAQMAAATCLWRVFDEITYKRVEGSNTVDYPNKYYDGSGSNAGIPESFVVMAPCGGPIAYVHKKSPPGSSDVKYAMVFQNLPRHAVKSREFDRGTIVLVDWTINEDLLIVTKDGTYHTIDIFHYNTNNDKSTTLGESVSTIINARTFKTNQGTGLVALKENQEGFVAVKDVYNPRIQTISLGADIRSSITAWCVIDHADITLAYAYDNIIATCTAVSSRRDQQTIPEMTAAIIRLVTSSNYKSIAMLKDNGNVLISSKENIGQPQSFTLKYTSNNDKNKISDIAWCGSDAVIGIRSSSKIWFDLLIINGKHSVPMTEESQQMITNDTLCYTAPVYLSTEIDGVRIMSGRSLDFFQRLPDELFSVFDLRSDSPGAKLYNAYINYTYERQMAETFLQQLKSSRSTDGLEEAVRQCILAASVESDSSTQKLLLRAAAFGRSFLYVNLTNPKHTTRPAVSVIIDRCTTIIRNLRLLHNLQHIDISLPMTYKQFELIGTRMLIDRLLRRGLHDFARDVTKLLHIPAEEGSNRILVQWAFQQLANPSNLDEDALADQIKKKLADAPGIPFIDIIKQALKLGKKTVVKRLLTVKVSLSDQIDMLLSLGEKEEALQKALSCGDTDLALFVLMRIKSSESHTQFMIRLQREKSLPLKLYLQCLEELERNNLHNDIIKRNPDERHRIAYSHIIQRFTTINTSDQKSELTSAYKLFREAKLDSVAQLVEDETRLITKQDDLEKKCYGVQLKGLSLVDTLEELLVNFDREADQLRKDFAVTDKRYWWIKIQAYAKKNSWEQLIEFGKKPTSPIGYEPFIDVCIRSQKMVEARRFADRSLYSAKLDDERLPYMFAKVQMVDEAISSAIKLKSIDALHFIESTCHLNEASTLKVRQAKEKLQGSDDNPLINVWKMLYRGARGDE